MKISLDQIFNDLKTQNKTFCIEKDLQTSEIYFQSTTDVSNKIKVESYFTSPLSYYVRETEPLQIISSIQQAKKAQLKVENWSFEQIREQLVKIKSVIYKNQETVARLEAYFQGTTTKFQVQWSVQPLLELIDQMIESDKHTLSFAPKGLIGAIIPKTNSFFEIGWRVLYSLFHKDALLLKPATEGSLSAVMWHSILQESECPEGLVSFIFGPGERVGKFLLDHPAIRNLSFSGSFDSMKSFTPSLEKKYQFFFNGKNSVCVLPDYNSAANFETIMRFFIEQNGKSVFSPSRLFVIDSMEKEFKAKLEQYLKNVPTLTSTEDDFGFLPLNASEKNKLAEIKMKFEQEDAKLIYKNDNFLFYSDLPNCSEWHQENLELPIFNLTSVKYSHEMIRWVNNSSFGHSVVIFGSEEKSKNLIQKTEVGHAFLNTPPVQQMLFRPAKLSGFGETDFKLPNTFFGYCK